MPDGGLSQAKLLSGLALVLVAVFAWFFNILVARQAEMDDMIYTGKIRLAVIEERISKLEEECNE